MTTRDRLLGTEVGNYRLIRLLGEGGMGRVYVGEQAAIASRVAIKVLSTHDPDLVARFFAEARAVNLLRHPALVKVHALSHLPDGLPYIIMDLVEGETLRALVVRDSPLPIAGVLDVVRQLLACLAVAHAAGVVHRDLKPDNVMISPDGTVRVLDFGIAKLSAIIGSLAPRTETGSRIGTPAYMAPEQIRGDEVDARTDLYSVGVVMYEALTGQLPFDAPNEFELMRAHLESPPRQVSRTRRDIPASLERVLDQALAKAPNERFQSAAAMASALDLVLASIPGGAQRLIARPAISAQLPAMPSAPPTVADGPSDATKKETPRRQSPPDPAQRETVPDAAQRETVRGDAAQHETASSTVAPPSRRMQWWIPAVCLVAAGGAFAAVRVVRHHTTPPAPPTATPPAARDVEVTVDAAFSPAGPAAPTIKLAKDDATGVRTAALDVPISAQHFDALANVPVAEGIGHSLVPDLALESLQIDAVMPDGTVSFDDDNLVEYRFVVPGAADHAAGSEVECEVSVVATAKRWLATTRPTAKCPTSAARIPPCGLSEVRKHALTHGVHADEPIAVELTGRGWNVLVGDRHRQRLVFTDTCETAVTAVPTDPFRPVPSQPAHSTPSLDAMGLVSEPYDFDGKHFDVVGYLPKVAVLAKKLVPDAELTGLEIERADDNGLIDVTVPNAVAIVFGTPSDGATCQNVAIVFIAGKIIASHRSSTACRATPEPLPRCPLKSIVARAKNPHGQFQWLRGKWFVDGLPGPAEDCK